MTIEYIRNWVNREGEWIKQIMANRVKTKRIIVDLYANE